MSPNTAILMIFLLNAFSFPMDCAFMLEIPRRMGFSKDEEGRHGNLTVL
jgi:hypothetical protein